MDIMPYDLTARKTVTRVDPGTFSKDEKDDEARRRESDETTKQGM